MSEKLSPLKSPFGNAVTPMFAVPATVPSRRNRPMLAPSEA
jgi:hypothetical protein